MQKIKNIVVEEGYFKKLLNSKTDFEKLIQHILNFSFEDQQQFEDNFDENEYMITFARGMADTIMSYYKQKTYHVYDYESDVHGINIKDVAVIEESDYNYEPLGCYYLIYSTEKEVPLCKTDYTDIFFIPSNTLTKI